MRSQKQNVLRKMQMRKGEDDGAWVGVATLVILSIIVMVWLAPLKKTVAIRSLVGVVLVQDVDPAKQVPVPDAGIEVSSGRVVVNAKSDQSGYFRLTLPGRLPNRSEILTIRHPSYQPFESNGVNPNLLYVARLTPKATGQKPAAAGESLGISNVRIRSTVKSENTVDIGSIVRPFQVPNVGNVPCPKGSICSPNGKWKATVTKATYDAGDNNQFIDIRVSCIAGPCDFTRIEKSNIDSPVRKMELSILNWSDTATYLIEAEVSRTMVNNMVRESYPAIFGDTMNFTLPSDAEGPSIQAELNGTAIVFPLGPNLLLSWGTCTARTAREQTRLFRCELKPGFAFQ